MDSDRLNRWLTLGANLGVIVAHQKQRNGQPLSDEESILLNQFASATLRLWENTHYQYRNGLFDDAEFEADLAVWREEMQKPEFKLHWSSHRHTYSEAFRAQIDEIME